MELRHETLKTLTGLSPLQLLWGYVKGGPPKVKNYCYPKVAACLSYSSVSDVVTPAFRKGPVIVI